MISMIVSIMIIARSALTISIHTIINLRVSNPGAIACVHFNMPSEGYNLPGAEPISRFKTGRSFSTKEMSTKEMSALCENTYN